MPVPASAQAVLDKIGTGRLRLAQVESLLPQALNLSGLGKSYVLHHFLQARCTVREQMHAHRLQSKLYKLRDQTEYDHDSAHIALTFLPNRSKNHPVEREIPTSEINDDQLVSLWQGPSWMTCIIEKVIEGISAPLDMALAAELRRAIQWIAPDDLFTFCTMSELLQDGSLKIEAVKNLIQAEAQKGSLAQAELRLVLAAPSQLWRKLLQATGRDAYLMGDKESEDSTPLILLSAPGYMEFAEQSFAKAHQRLADIHSGAEPFAADKAFSLADAHVVGRIAALSLAADMPWCRAHLRDIWMMAAEAPDPKKKSVPSQSVAISFAHATVKNPLPYAVHALAEVRAVVRHAGVEKKLKKALRAAESAIAARPDLVMQLPASEPIPPKLKKAVQRSIEHLLKLPEFVPLQKLRDRLFDQKELAEIARTLVWETPDGMTLRPTLRGWADTSGSLHRLAPEDALRLWHPVDASPELRSAWRGALRRDDVTQAFNQAYREHYRPPDESLRTTQVQIFTDTDVLMTRIVPVAASLGLAVADSEYVFIQGEWAFSQPMGTHHLHPGSQSNGRLGPLTLMTPGKTFADVPPRIVSEILRTVDLLAALGTADYDTLRAHSPASSAFYRAGQQTAQMRRQVLGWTFKGALDRGELVFDRNHAVVSDLRVHLATGRATLAGDPVTLPSRQPLPPLPYRDETLQKIARHVANALT